MRTTVRLEDELLAEAKALAARTGRTLTEVIEDSLRATLSHDPRARARVELPVLKGGRVRAGVNLDSMSDLIDIMEGDEAP
jgi:hypothetical protein